MSSRKHLDEARRRWRELPEPLRLELAEALVNREAAASCKERLSDLLLAGPLAVPNSRPSEGQRQRLREMLERIVAPLFEARRDGVFPPFAAAYAQHLLALVLPLLQPDSGHEELTGLLERAGSHEVLAPLARERATAGLADELMRAAGEELLAKAREIASPPAQPPNPPRWLDRPDKLLLSVDHVTLSCARYLAGLQAPERDRYGYDELRAGPGGRAKRVDQVTVKFDPQSASALAGVGAGAHPAAGSEGSELKAKLFVALFALAAQSKSRGDSGTQRVRLRDLLNMVGFELGRSTNSEYYWRYASQLTRHLLIDLPGRVVAMQLQLAGEPQPRVVFEPLLERALPLDVNGQPLAPAVVGSLHEALRGMAEESPLTLRDLGVAGFEFALSDELLQAHGIGKRLSAIEHVPAKVLSLKGPAFWLAWQVAFLRRWAVPPSGGAGGKPLLRALEETGHLAACSRGGRVRYKDALTSWWRDSGELAAIGLLDEPGVRLYAPRGGSWREVSAELSRSLDPGGSRLTRALLEDVRVVFQIPRSRVESLKEARRRKGRRPARAAGT